MTWWTLGNTTKRATPVQSGQGLLGTTAAQWPAQMNSPTARVTPAAFCHKPRHPLGAADLTTAANDSIWSTEGIKCVTTLSFDSPAHASFGYASRRVWITDLSQLLITVNELGRRELAINLCWTQHLVRDPSQLWRLRLTIRLQDMESCPTFLLGISTRIWFSCSLANWSWSVYPSAMFFHLHAGFVAHTYDVQTSGVS